MALNTLPGDIRKLIILDTQKKPIRNAIYILCSSTRECKPPEILVVKVKGKRINKKGLNAGCIKEYNLLRIVSFTPVQGVLK